MKPADRRELKRFPCIRPVTAAAAAFGGAVVEQQSVSELERRAADGEVNRVVATRERVSRSPASEEIVRLER